MKYIYSLIFVLNLIKILKGELSLEIFKDINGTQVPVYETVQVFAGTNLTLTCKLVPIDNDTSNYRDDNLSWGRKRRNVAFKTVEDLQKLFDDSLKPLHQFLEKSDRNKAELRFNPLFLFNSGKYFCMSLKYRLFNIVEVIVELGLEDADMENYFKAMEQSQLDFRFIDLHGPLHFPKFLCTDDMFVCNLGGTCFDYKYVCDNVKDCSDGSDENFYLCGGDPCAGKIPCSRGRCIEQSLCCDKFRDPDCTVNVKPACCPKSEEKYLDDWTPPFIASHDDDFEYSPNDVNRYDVDVQDIWNDNNKEVSPKRDTLWIVVPCSAVLILVILIIMIRQFLTKPSRRPRATRSPHCTISMPAPDRGRISPISSRVSTVSSAPGTNSTRASFSPNRSINGSLPRSFPPNMNQIYDLPPSYEEAVGNSHPSVPRLGK